MRTTLTSKTNERGAGELESVGSILTRIIETRGEFFSRQLQRYGGTPNALAPYSPQPSAETVAGARAPSLPREGRAALLNFAERKEQRRP
jgi:hypothetical protein